MEMLGVLLLEVSPLTITDIFKQAFDHCMNSSAPFVPNRIFACQDDYIPISGISMGTRTKTSRLPPVEPFINHEHMKFATSMLQLERMLYSNCGSTLAVETVAAETLPIIASVLKTILTVVRSRNYSRISTCESSSPSRSSSITSDKDQFEGQLLPIEFHPRIVNFFKMWDW